MRNLFFKGHIDAESVELHVGNIYDWSRLRYMCIMMEVVYRKNLWAKYIYTAQFEGYLFPHWDDDDKIRVDTVFVNGGMNINHKSKVSFFEQ